MEEVDYTSISDDYHRVVDAAYRHYQEARERAEKVFERRIQELRASCSHPQRSPWIRRSFGEEWQTCLHCRQILEIRRTSFAPAPPVIPIEEGKCG